MGNCRGLEGGKEEWGVSALPDLYGQLPALGPRLKLSARGMRR